MPRHPFGLLAVVKMRLQSRCVGFDTQATQPKALLATGLNLWINLLGINEAYNRSRFH